MTSQAPVEKTRTTPDGDAHPTSDTESPTLVTESGPAVVVDGPAADDTPTGGLTAGAADAAVRGVDEVLGREVRLVTLPPASGEVLSERIEQVRHLARLHHPHLLEVYDVDGLAPDTESTLVLENVPGEPLPLVLRDGPIAEPALARMGAQLASALAHAHAHGVEHGAIGAASILVDRANSDAWLIGLTASLSGPLPIVDPETDDDGDGAARRRDADVRALAATLAEVVEHTAATEGGDDPDAVTRPTTRDANAPVSPLVAVLRGVDSPTPPSAALLSERLVRVARGGGRAVPEDRARLVPVVASWSESPAVAGSETPEVPVVGPAVRASGVTPFAVVGRSGRRARRAGVLGAATATLALASGLVIWAGEAHIVRPESQAEVGASGPAVTAPAPVVPHVPSFGGLSGGGWSNDGGSGSGSSSSGGSDDVVGVASRRAALPERTTRSSTEPTTTSQRPVFPPPGSGGPSSGPTGPADPTSYPPTSTRPTTTQPTPTTRPTTTRPSTTVPTTTQSTTQPTTTQPVTSSSTTVPTGTSTGTSTATAPTGSTTGTSTTGTTTGTGSTAGTTTDGTTPTSTTPPTAQVLAAGR